MENIYQFTQSLSSKISYKKINISFIVVVFFYSLINSTKIYAVTKTCTGAGFGTWATATWSPAGVPTSADDAIIKSGVNISINTAAVCGSLQFGDGGNSATTLTFASGGSLIISGTSGHLDINPFSRKKAFTINIGTQTLTIAGAVIYPLSGTSSISVSTGTLTVGMLLTLGTRDRLIFAGAGTANLNGGLSDDAGSFSLFSGCVVKLGGNYKVTGAAVIWPSGSTCIFTNNATITPTAAITFDNVQFNSGTVTLAGSVNVNGNLSILTGATFDVSISNFNINIGKNWNNNGSFLSQNGTVTFNGTVAQTIGGTSIANFKNITLNNLAGASLAQAQNLTGTLTLTLGTFATNAQVFTLISDVNGTARIATISAGANITGNITMQRYIGAGATNWRFLTTATSGTTINDWKDDFIMSGFIGSQYPDWPSVANRWPSIYFYNETIPGIMDSGYVAATNTTNTISPGQGVWVWSGDTITGTQAFTVDVTGTANKGNINLPVSFTSSGGAANDGWSMVGNPYPSTIDWDSANWTKTRINGAIYIWNPQNQQFASYVGGIGTNGGSRYISSSQAFWVQANAASPVLQIKETCKSAVNQAFLKEAVDDQQLLTFGVQMGVNHDEAILRFIEGATNDFDADFDAIKMASSDPAMPYIALINNIDALSVNSYNLHQSITMPVKVLATTDGLATLTFDKLNMTDLSCAILEDLVTGTKIDIIANSSYTYYHTSTTTTARFLLHLWNNKVKEVVGPSCFESTNAQIIAQTSGNGPWQFDLSNSNGVVSNFNTTIDSNVINNLSSGTYYLQIVDQSATCSASIDTIEIANPTPIIFSSNLTNPSSVSSNDGGIDLTVSGGFVPYVFSWTNTATTEDLTNIVSGVYEVTITDSNGCIANEVITLDFLTGINKLLSDESFVLFPNPAKDMIVFEGKNLPGTILTITTISGQVILCENITSTKEKISIVNFSSGVYFYELNNGESQYKGKLMVANK